MDRKRRDFLSMAAASLGTAAALREVSAQDNLSEESTDQRSQGRTTLELGPVDDPSITTNTIAEAEKLAAVKFTQAERQMMLETLGTQLERFKERQTYTLPNNLATATRFDPRLPGTTTKEQNNRVTGSVPTSRLLPSNDRDIAFSSITELSEWIRTGQISSSRLTEIYIERLRRLGPELECVVTMTENLAREQAAQADQEISAGNYIGPLHGIPWGAKDLLATEQILTTWGAGPYRNQILSENAKCVELLHNAGAVLVAKLTLGALAFGDVWYGGKTRNPWNTDEGSSGSSAGPAAATAAGLVGFSIGSETLGSIVSPSMRCGPCGLRPTYGRVSRAGAMALAWSLDKLGPICRTVEDTGHVLAAINGYDPADAGSIDMPFEFDANANTEGLKVGYIPALFEDDNANDVERSALQATRNLGIDLVEIELPSEPFSALITILEVEAAAAFEELTLTDRDEELIAQGPSNWPNRMRQWRFTPAIELIQAERIRLQVMKSMHKIYDQVDVILAPSFSPLLLITNMTGHPSLTLRAGFIQSKARGSAPSDVPTDRISDNRTDIEHRVPHGITLCGRLFEEGRLLNLGTALENFFGVWRERPPVG